MKGDKMSIRSSLSLLLKLALMGFLGFQNSAGQGGQSGSIVASIKLKRIKLIATTVGGGWRDTKCAYKLGESTLVRLSLVNQTDQYVPIREIRGRRFSQYRIDLLRDGALVEPRPEVTRMLNREAAGDDIWSSVTTSDPVKPYQTAIIGLIRLDERYDKLPAGHYHLIAKYRIANSKEMEVAATADFFVVP